MRDARTLSRALLVAALLVGAWLLLHATGPECVAPDGHTLTLCGTPGAVRVGTGNQQANTYQ